MPDISTRKIRSDLEGRDWITSFLSRRSMMCSMLLCSSLIFSSWSASLRLKSSDSPTAMGR